MAAIENADTNTPPNPGPEPKNPNPNPNPDLSVEQARKQERDKLQATIDLHKTSAEKERAERERAQAEAKAAADQAKEAKARVRELEEASLSKEEKTERRLSELQDAVKTLKEALETQAEQHRQELERVADQAVSHVKNSDLRAELARLTAGLNLDPDLMPTIAESDTPATLAEKVNRAKALQDRISGKQADDEAEKVRREAEENLPSPIAPDGSRTPSRTENVKPPTDPKERRRLANIKDPDAYQELRAKMLADAAAGVPEGNPYVRR